MRGMTPKMPKEILGVRKLKFDRMVLSMWITFYSHAFFVSIWDFALRVMGIL